MSDWSTLLTTYKEKQTMTISQQDYSLMLPRFDYLAPKTINEVCLLLSKYGDKVKIMSGGTDLLVSMRQKKIKPGYVINIKGIPKLDYIHYSQKEGLRIGALATLHSIAISRVIGERFGLLRTACHKIGTPQVRNMGTIGGNICNGGPSQDSVPSLLVLGARLKLVSLQQERIVPIDEFFIGPFQTAIDQMELLTEIQIPTPPPGSATCYKWLSKRNEIDETLVGVAVLMKADSADNVCRDIKIGLCSVSPTPIRATRAEQMLQGQKIESKTIELASRVAAEETSPRSRAQYRRQMTSFLVKRAIIDVCQKIKQSDR
jgi:CO/xanthine dehydrogenase FAD-binding subunit